MAILLTKILFGLLYVHMFSFVCAITEYKFD